MKQSIFLLLTILFYSHLHSQNVGIGTTQPQASAVLDLQSTNKGLLIPRMTSTQRNSIVSPARGLMVFDTNKGLIYLFDGIQWLPMVASAGNIPFVSNVVSNVPTIDENFGYKVAISGNYAVISCVDEAGPDVGVAYIYSNATGAWKYEAKLTSGDPAAGIGFGLSVAIANDQVLIGAPKRNSNRGAVYAYARSGAGVWSQTAIITQPVEQQGSQFGSSIMIDGVYALIGAPNYVQNGIARGSIYCYMRNLAGWQYTQQLLGEPAHEGFGYSIDMADQHAVIGAPWADYSGFTDVGYIYLFKRTGTQWALLSSDGIGFPSSNIYFGKAVAINSRENLWVFASYNYEMTGEHYGAVNCNVLYPDGLHSVANFGPPGVNNVEPYFASSISSYGDYLVVGSPYKLNEHAAAGRVYVYKIMLNNPGSWGDYWKPYRTIIDRDAYSDQNDSKDCIGMNVFINGFDIAIGNPHWQFKKGKVLFMNVE